MTLVIVTPAFFFVALPKKAEATVPVWDWVNEFSSMIPHWLEAIIQTVYQAVIEVETTISAVANDWLSFVKEADLDGVMWALKQMIIIEVTQMMMDFINNGFQGGPAYIEDPGLHYYNISNELTDTYLKRLVLMREDFTDPGSLAEYILERTEENLRAEEYEELGSRLVAQDENQFPGGYAAYEQFVEDPSTCPTGNPYDCMLVMLDEENDLFNVHVQAREQLNKQRTEGLETNYQQVSSSDEFHTFKRCAEEIARGGVSFCESYITTLPGKVIVDQLQYYLQSQMNELHQADEIDELIAGVLFDLATGWMGGQI